MERDDIFEEDPSDRSPLALDQEILLNDQFRIGRVLGVGGFGITYLAFDEVLEMVVAVKEYLPNDIAVRKGTRQVQPLSSTGESQDFEFGLERFLGEARTLAKFEAHPNIVRVRNFFRQNGTGYLVMNFYEGRTLAEYLKARNGFLPEEEALLIMEQVVDGLSTVHEEDILHRDIDPNNIYLADNGTVVLLDFGAARTAIGERTQSMSVVLKRGYAPHEQYHSHGDQGPWTDIYACAATLYRTLTGYKPPEAAARILEDDLAEPKALVPSLSEATNEAVLEGLAIRPDDRPQTMDDFAALLPDPPADAEPGWIGEVSTTEASGGREGASAELRLTTTHPCRLYVDGSQAAELEPDETYTVGVDTGSHRLRAVRTDQATDGNATVTASGSSIEEEEGDSRLTLQALIWQNIVSAGAKTPTSVDIDFTDEDAASTLDQLPDGDDATVAGDTTEVPDPDAETDVPDAVADPEPTEETDPASTDTAGEAADEETGSEEAAGEQELRDPSAETVPPEPTGDGASPPSEEEEADEERAPAGPATTPPAGDGTPAGASGTGLDLEDIGVSPPVLGAAGAAAVVLLGLGWWLLSNTPPRPQADRVLTTGSAVTVDVLANDEDPDDEPLRMVAAGPVPDSVARVAVLDSARLRIRPAASFAGVFQIPYAVVDPPGDTARSSVSLRVPFNGRARTVTAAVQQPQVVHADSLGDDGDLDVVLAALGENAVVWSENTLAEDGQFRPPETIQSSPDGVVDVHTADLNDDGRADVLSASLQGDRVAWHENQGQGTFGEGQSIVTEADGPAADGAAAVRATDVDGDGTEDVVVGSVLGEVVSWFENDGTGSFGAGATVAEGVKGLETLHLADLDNDAVQDLLVVAYQDSTIARYEPARRGDSVRFVKRTPIGTSLREPIEVHAADVLGNGRPDVLAGKVGEKGLVLFESRVDTSGTPADTADALAFVNKRVLAPDLRTVEAIDTADLDGDGDLDIFAASFKDDRVVWIENRGNGSFGAPQPIATGVPNVISLEVTDVDRDGDPDILVASQAESRVNWYENRLQAPGR